MFLIVLLEREVTIIMLQWTHADPWILARNSIVAQIERLWFLLPSHCLSALAHLDLNRSGPCSCMVQRFFSFFFLVCVCLRMHQKMMAPESQELHLKGT